MRSPLGSIGLRVTAPVLVLSALLVGVMTWQLYRQAGRSRVETLDAYGRLLGRLVDSHLREAMQAKHRARLQRQIARISELAPIAGVQVLNKSGKVIFASDPSAVGDLLAKDAPLCRACHGHDGRVHSRAQTINARVGGREVLRTVQTINAETSCLTCHQKKRAGQPLGVLVTDLDEQRLIGGLHTRAVHAAWLAGGMSLLIGIALVISVRRLVVTRLRRVRAVIDRLRTGRDPLSLIGGTHDELDELARSMQSLVINLDGEAAVQKIAGRVVATLEGYPGPALLLDAERDVLAANRLARQHFLAPLIGRPRSELADDPGDRFAAAAEAGWSMPDGEGGALIALADAAAEIVGFLELHEASASEDDGGEDAPAPDRDSTWSLVLFSTLRRLVPGAKKWKGVLGFDRRLALGRRLLRDLQQAAKLPPSDVDLCSLALLALFDAQQELPAIHWHHAFEPPLTLTCERYPLKVLIERLLHAAGRQAGAGGHVLLFSQFHRGRAFVGAWASRPGGQAALEATPRPRLALAIARGYGGGVEVDPAFEIDTLLSRRGLRLPCGKEGTLYLAELHAATPRGEERI